MRRCAPSGPRARSPLAMARNRAGLAPGELLRPHAAGNRGRRYRIGGACEPPKPADRPCATMATRQPKQTRKEAPWKIPKAESQRRIFQGKSPTALAQTALCVRSARTPARWPRGRRGSAVRASPRAARWWTPTTDASRRWRPIPSRRSRWPAFALEARFSP